MFERPRSKRYGWHRRYNGFVSHPKWRAVAILTALPITQVIGVVDFLCEAANKGDPRGSVAEFSVLECAVALDMPQEHVQRAYAALEQIGWLDREYLSTWDERQPDKEDPTAQERQRRRRTKLKAQRASRRDGTAKERSKRYRDGLKKKRAANGLNGDSAVTRDVTPKTQTQTSKKAAASVTDIATGDRVTWDKAEAWLKEHRTGQRPLPLGLVGLKQRGSR